METMETMENVFVETDTNTDTTSPPVPLMVLTRYLYIKEDVLASLCFAILDKQCDEAVFWTCELYYSGFEQDVADYLMATYREMFRSLNPRLGPFLETMHRRCMEGAEYVATIARNLAAPARKYDVTAFLAHDVDPPICPTSCDRKFYITLRKTDIEKYKTVECNDPRQVLAQGCVFPIRKYGMELFECRHRSKSDQDWTDLLTEHRTKWIYYASFSPLWARRIAEFGGIVDHNRQTVDFANDEDEDAEDRFYEIYGYDLDEQTETVQGRILHLAPTKQMTKQQFCTNYGGTMKTVRRVKKGNHSLKNECKLTSHT